MEQTGWCSIWVLGAVVCPCGDGVRNAESKSVVKSRIWIDLSAVMFDAFSSWSTHGMH
jgi:hypothetical protein